MSYNPRKSRHRRLFAGLLALGLLLPAFALAQTPPAAPAAAAPSASPVTPSAAPLAAAPTQKSEALLQLPRDLSPWGMFMAADMVV